LIFEETVAMRTQDLELKKWKIHEQPSVHCNVLHCWYEYEIRYIISFQFKVKPASEEDTLLKLCVIDIVCTILKKNMQVGCHISVVLKDQLILKIVYDKNLSWICLFVFFRLFSQKLSRKFVYKCAYESLVISRNTTTEIG
jgi:hypothetical protein